MRRLATGPGRKGPDSSDLKGIVPVIRTITSAFGPERLIYGGGFGADATGASYRAYRARLLSYLTHLSDADQAKVTGGNAAQIFKFS